MLQTCKMNGVDPYAWTKLTLGAHRQSLAQQRHRGTHVLEFQAPRLNGAGWTLTHHRQAERSAQGEIGNSIMKLWKCPPISWGALPQVPRVAFKIVCRSPGSREAGKPGSAQPAYLKHRYVVAELRSLVSGSDIIGERVRCAFCAGEVGMSRFSGGSGVGMPRFGALRRPVRQERRGRDRGSQAPFVGARTGGGKREFDPPRAHLSNAPILNNFRRIVPAVASAYACG